MKYTVGVARNDGSGEVCWLGVRPSVPLTDLWVALFLRWVSSLRNIVTFWARFPGSLGRVLFSQRN